MREITFDEMNQVQGGDVSAWGCFALGVAFGAGLAAGAGGGWIAAGIALGTAIDSGCFD